MTCGYDNFGPVCLICLLGGLFVCLLGCLFVCLFVLGFLVGCLADRLLFLAGWLVGCFSLPLTLEMKFI